MPSAVDTAFRTSSWRGVRPRLLRMNRPSATCAARCNRCTTDSLGLASGIAVVSSLVEEAKEVQEDDHNDRNACEPKDDVSEHGASSLGWGPVHRRADHK